MNVEFGLVAALFYRIKRAAYLLFALASGEKCERTQQGGHGFLYDVIHNDSLFLVCYLFFSINTNVGIPGGNSCNLTRIAVPGGIVEDVTLSFVHLPVGL